MRSRRKIIAILATALSLSLLALAVSPLTGFAADHLDAPGLTSPSDRGDADINDLFVFEGSGAFAGGSTVLAVTTNPAAGAIAPDLFATDVLYQIKIDTDGDAVEDITYKVTFKDPLPNGRQPTKIKVATGNKAQSNRNNGTVVGRVRTGKVKGLQFADGLQFAGLRSDPFFFDLGGFLGTVEGADNGRMLNDGSESDFFDGLNVMSIVLELPDSDLAPSIGVWATTHIKTGSGFMQADRMGRPAINTVVNSSGPVVMADSDAKNVFNAGVPSDDVADFTDAVVAALTAFSSLDSEGSYAVEQAEALAGVLLPDVLTFDKSGTLPPPLNGRGLADDVIDTELNIVTGGDPLGLFGDRDAVGGVTTDGVGAHTDLLPEFPYLGVPN